MRLEPLISHTGIIDDALSINNSRFAEFLPLIYPPELEVRDHRYSFVRIIFGLIPRI
jgi:hypothetical protein